MSMKLGEEIEEMKTIRADNIGHGVVMALTFLRHTFCVCSFCQMVDRVSLYTFLH